MTCYNLKQQFAVIKDLQNIYEIIDANNLLVFFEDGIYLEVDNVEHYIGDTIRNAEKFLIGYICGCNDTARHYNQAAPDNMFDGP